MNIEETVIELGTLVRSVDDGCLGIVTWCDDPNNQLLPIDRVYQVTWADSLRVLHYSVEFEVIARTSVKICPPN